MSATERVHLFSNGTEAADWIWKNCDRCALDADLKAKELPPVCPLRMAIIEGYVGDGTFDAALATEYGMEREPYTHLPNKCPKWEPSADVLANAPGAA